MHLQMKINNLGSKIAVFSLFVIANIIVFVTTELNKNQRINASL